MASKSTKQNGNAEAGAEQPVSTALVPVRDDLAFTRELIEELEKSESLSEIAPEDRLIPHECFNVKIQKDGQWVAPNRFFNTVTEEVSDEIDAVLLFMKKSRRYVEWDDSKGSTLVCYSLDMATGNWREPPELRQCESCPLPLWTNGRCGDPPKCKLVWNFVGINLRTREPFIISAKSTSLRPVRQFLNKHFIGKMRGKNLPLFCYMVKLKLYQPIGTYAVLQPEIGPAFSIEDIGTWYRLSRELWDSRRIDLTQTPPEEGSEKEESDLPF
jgi:hypothetical protein